jgi:hypothetical protein
MFLAISFSRHFFDENKSTIEEYLKNKLGEGNAFDITFDELPNEVLYQFNTDVETFLEVLNHFFFNNSVDAIGSLVLPIHYHYFLQMREFGYLEKIIKNNYKSFFKQEMMGNVYVVLDLSQYRQFEKLLLLNQYFDNSWDEEDQEDGDGDGDGDGNGDEDNDDIEIDEEVEEDKNIEEDKN